MVKGSDFKGSISHIMEQISKADPPAAGGSAPPFTTDMKYVLTSILLFFCILSLNAQVYLTRFSESVYICEDYYFARENTLVYIGQEYITIIGATWCPESAKALHDSISRIIEKPVLEVINTNYHPDRAGGNPYWKSIGCKIHSTENTFDLMRIDWDTICNFIRNSSPEFPKIPLVLPSNVHSGNFKLQEGSIEVLYFGPSHTEDGVFVYLPEEKILYGGCILKPFLGNLEQSNLKEYPRTLNKLKNSNLDIKTIIAGHGQSINDVTLIDNYLTMLREYSGTSQ